MKSNRINLKGKTIFIVAMITVGMTVLTVYLTGINYHRSVSANLFISLGIIASVLFSFLTFGLYYGIRLVNNYPKFEGFEPGVLLESHKMPELDLQIGDGILGVLFSIVLWIGMAVLLLILLLLFEALLWLSLFVIFAMIYWVFLRALKLALTKSPKTRGNLWLSARTALAYTLMYMGWMFIIAFLAQELR